MKITVFSLLLLVFTSCGKSGEHASHNHDGDAPATDNPNQALYSQVMEIHDEVMPKTGDIYSVRKELKEKFDKSSDEKEKERLKSYMALLDSADQSMMDWMHNFNPIDTVDQEEAREYLESEIEKIKKVKVLVNESLDKANGELGKKN